MSVTSCQAIRAEPWQIYKGTICANSLENQLDARISGDGKMDSSGIRTPSCTEVSDEAEQTGRRVAVESGDEP